MGTARNDCGTAGVDFLHRPPDGSELLRVAASSRPGPTGTKKRRIGNHGGVENFQ